MSDRVRLADGTNHILLDFIKRALREAMDERDTALAAAEERERALSGVLMAVKALAQSDMRQKGWSWILETIVSEIEAIPLTETLEPPANREP